jgi:PAS domain S-box-containing protein
MGLEDERQRLRSILDSSPMGVAIIADDTARFANPSMARMGLWIDEKASMAFVNPADNEKIMAVFREDRFLRNFETQLNGVDKPVDVLMSLYEFEYEGEQAILWWVIDITMRKAVEREARRTNERYQKLVEEIGQKFVIFSHNPGGEMIFASEGISSVFGISRDEVIGKNWVDLITWAEGEVEKINDLDETMVRERMPFLQFEAVLTRPDGSESTILISQHPVWSPDGSLLSIDGIVEDISERKAAELALARPVRGRGGGPRQVRVPGQHVPRDPNAHERQHGPLPPGSPDRSGLPAAGLHKQGLQIR